jgi:hypothetical protein
MNKAHFEDQVRLAGAYAAKLAKRNGYYWKKWGEQPDGRCTAAFDREGETWSLSFSWHPSEGLDALKSRIENMDAAMLTAMRDFKGLKAGAAMRDAGNFHSSLAGQA